VQHKFSGVVIPMITPFNNDNNIDCESLNKMLEFYLASQCIPFILGTTGEAVSMSRGSKHKLLIESVKIVHRRAPVFAGISDTCLDNVLELAYVCKNEGVDAVVAHLPAYYPITEQEVLDYFQNLADACPLPLIVYNIPATTKISIPVSVVEKLSLHPNIIGLKDSERSLERMALLSEKFTQRPDFLLYSGWTTQSLHALNIGFNGIVPSTGNIIPHMFNDLIQSVKNNNKELAIEIQEKINPIAEYHQKDKVLSEVISLLKVMMNKKHLCDLNVLPPLQKYPEDMVTQVYNDMEKFGL
jgi:dihydrodipicolinate synthase/N-acetylneuraminate lyase